MKKLIIGINKIGVEIIESINDIGKVVLFKKKLSKYNYDFIGGFKHEII